MEEPSATPGPEQARDHTALLSFSQSHATEYVLFLLSSRNHIKMMRRMTPKSNPTRNLKAQTLYSEEVGNVYSLQAPRHRHRLPRAGEAGGVLAKGGPRASGRSQRVPAKYVPCVLQADPASPRTELYKQGWRQKAREVSQAAGKKPLTESCPHRLSLRTGSPAGHALGRTGSLGDGNTCRMGCPWDRLSGGWDLWGRPLGRTGSPRDRLSGGLEPSSPTTTICAHKLLTASSPHPASLRKGREDPYKELIQEEKFIPK